MLLHFFKTVIAVFFPLKNVVFVSNVDYYTKQKSSKNINEKNQRIICFLTSIRFPLLGTPQASWDQSVRVMYGAVLYHDVIAPIIRLLSQPVHKQQTS